MAERALTTTDAAAERLLAELTAAREVCEAAEKTITTCPCKEECSCAYAAEYALGQALSAWRRAWSDSPAGPRGELT